MRIRTHHALLAAAVATGASAVVPALAQDLPGTRIITTVRATPDKAGTSKSPRGVAISATAQLISPPDLDPPIVTGIEILVGKGLAWNGDKYATCAQQTLERHGPSGCPRTSIMGSATATGMADTVAARLDIVFVNGGLNTRYAYATLNNPARVRDTIVINASHIASGPWDHRETLRVPANLQIVAGVPLRLTRIKMRVGGRSYARKYITSTSCPRGGWKYQVTAHYLYDAPGQNSDTMATGSIPCTK